MYKLTEEEYEKKKKEYKETFIYSKNKKKITISAIILGISTYFLFNGIIAFIYLMFHANDGQLLVNNGEIVDILITISSIFITLGITGTIFSCIKFVSSINENNKLLIKYIDKK